MATISEFVEIRKRDGRIVAFDPGKITSAIMRSAEAVQGSDYHLAEELAALVVAQVGSQVASHQIPGVEAIQDAIEKVLIEHGHARTAKAFILHRARRSRIREGKSELMDAVGDILDGAGSAPGASKHVAIGLAAARAYYMNRLLPERVTQAHQQGDFHLHGLAHYAQSPHGFVLPLARLLRDGFRSGHGAVRPPRRAGSAAALSAVLLRAAQAECHGGVAIAHFDTLMANLLPAETTRADLDQAMEAMVFALNTGSRLAGDAIPRASLHVGLDDRPMARAVALALLDAVARGLGRGEAALAPHIVVRFGANLAPAHPVHDVVARAATLAGSCMAITFMHDADDAVTLGHTGRLDLARSPLQTCRATLNLPRLALRARRDGFDLQEGLETLIRQVAQALQSRVDVLAARPVAEFPLLAGHQLLGDTAGRGPDETMAAAMRGGQASLAIVGLAETLMVLGGQAHGTSPSSQAEGLTILKRAAALAAELSDELGMDFVLMAGESGRVGQRFVRQDRREFGLLRGVTDGVAYTDGVALPTDRTATDHAARFAAEGACMPWLPGGGTTVIATSAAPGPDAVLAWLAAATAAGVRQVAIDSPLAVCTGCGLTSKPAETCPRCEVPGAPWRNLARHHGHLVIST